MIDVRTSCPRCGRRVRATHMARHKNARLCRERVASLEVRAKERIKRSYTAAVCAGYGPPGASPIYLFHRRRRVLAAFSLSYGKLLYSKRTWVKSQEAELVRAVRRAWPVLFVEHIEHIRDARQASALENVCAVVLRRCKRRRALQAQILSVARLGDSPDLAALLTARVPGIWSAIRKEKRR